MTVEESSSCSVTSNHVQNMLRFFSCEGTTVSGNTTEGLIQCDGASVRISKRLTADTEALEKKGNMVSSNVGRCVGWDKDNSASVGPHT